MLVDLLGHGDSDSPSDPTRYSMNDCINDLVGVLDSLGIERANWLGYSMGGRICLYLALTVPERCSSLVLEGASPGIADAKARRERAASDQALARRIDEKGIEEFIDHWEALPLFSGQSREVRKRLREQRLKERPGGTGQQPARHGRRNAATVARPFDGAGYAIPVHSGRGGWKVLQYRQVDERGSAQR